VCCVYACASVVYCLAFDIVARIFIFNQLAPSYRNRACVECYKERNVEMDGHVWKNGKKLGKKIDEQQCRWKQTMRNTKENVY